MTTHAHAKAAGPFVSRKLRDCEEAIRAAAPRVVADADDEAIHDLRVAIRRLRTLLKMSRKLFGRWHADVVRRAFADVMRATGELRDEEVLEETLEVVSAEPSFVAWLGARKARERKLRRAVVARLERGDLDRARLLLKALLVFPVPPKSDIELARFARRVVDRAHRGVETKRDVAPDDALGLHELRIAYKELRYSIELLSEALPIDQRAMLEPATVFQKRLGEIHDADVAIEVVRQAKKLPEGVRDAALAALAELREKRLKKYLRELDPLAETDRELHETRVEPAEVDPSDAPTTTNGSN
ncbi:MAG TPA: CHAD domain-containing protein [Labilithrix sp.]|jgi:CHAD domain-containing protein